MEKDGICCEGGKMLFDRPRLFTKNFSLFLLLVKHNSHNKSYECVPSRNPTRKILHVKKHEKIFNALEKMSKIIIKMTVTTLPLIFLTINSSTADCLSDDIYKFMISYNCNSNFSRKYLWEKSLNQHLLECCANMYSEIPAWIEMKLLWWKWMK